MKSSKIVAGVTVAFLNLAMCTVANATDVPELNQFGWSDDFYNSFFNCTACHDSFVPATGIGAFGAQQSSIAIAGTYED